MDLKSLRNFKFRSEPVTIKIEKVQIKIENQEGDSEYCISNNISNITPIIGEGASRSCFNNENSTSQSSIKQEAEDLEEVDTKMINVLPLNCQIQEPFGCTHCSFSTMCEDELQKHLAVHYMEKPFQCELCSFITKHRGALKKHMFTHSKIKRFYCDLCKFKTSYKCSLKTHEQTHTEDKYFNCVSCTYKTNFKKHFNLHMLCHTGKKSYYCDFCSFKSKKKGEIKKHILAHTKPFKCPLCLYQNSNESLVASHMLECCVLIRPKRRVPLN